MRLSKKDKIYIISGSILFLLITFLVMNGYTKVFDNSIYQFFMEFKNDNVTSFFALITNLGGFYCIAVITIIIYFYKYKEIGHFCMLNIILNTVLNNALKFIIQRDRPALPHLVKAGGYSFPSGHAMMSFAFYGLLMYFAYQKIKNKVMRNCVCAFLGIIVLLVGSSRIYLGVHFPSDVIAGFLVSSIYLIILIAFIKSNIFAKREEKR